MAAKNAGTKGRRGAAVRSKQQAEWLREQIKKTRPDWNPVLEMVELHHKRKLTKRDMLRFEMCKDIAQFVQPKVKQVQLDVAAGDDDGKSGAFVLSWGK